jgi:hypothetical protein
MRMFKRFALCLLAAAISSYAYADIIELDTFNPDHCRKQIISSNDQVPIIATYSSDRNDGNPNSEAFMAKFEDLAKKHPERTFYKWDVKKDVFHSTQALCLQQLGFVIQPNIMLVGVVKDEIMTSPLRLTWSGEMTTIEMNKFIEINSYMKQSFLSQKNVQK